MGTAAPRERTDNDVTVMDQGLRCVVGAAAVGILLGGLTACGGGSAAGPAEATDAGEGSPAPSGGTQDDDAGSEAEGAAEPVPASSEGPAQNWPEPELPAEAAEQTEEGVEAALRYWFETRQYARNTGDTAPLEAASYSECGFCSQQIGLVEETYEAGWLVQELDEVTENFVRFEDEGMATAIFLLDAGAYELYWEGDLHEEAEGEVGTGWSAAFAFENGSWVVADLRHFASANEVEEELEESM